MIYGWTCIVVRKVGYFFFNELSILNFYQCSSLLLDHIRFLLVNQVFGEEGEDFLPWIGLGV